MAVRDSPATCSDLLACLGQPRRMPADQHYARPGQCQRQRHGPAEILVRTCHQDSASAYPVRPLPAAANVSTRGCRPRAGCVGSAQLRGLPVHLAVRISPDRAWPSNSQQSDMRCRAATMIASTWSGTEATTARRRASVRVKLSGGQLSKAREILAVGRVAVRHRYPGLRSRPRAGRPGQALPHRVRT
jgi:hypothetical protein